MMIGVPQSVFATGLSLILSGYGYGRKSLSKSGAGTAFFVGFVSVLAGKYFWPVLIGFFLTSSKLTKVGAKRKEKIEDGYALGGQRNWLQVLCNGGFGAWLCVCITILFDSPPELPLLLPVTTNLDFVKILHSISPFSGTADASSVSLSDSDRQTIWGILFCIHIGAYSCVTADTWASELGTLITQYEPYLITSVINPLNWLPSGSFKQVPAGTNGGVTGRGLFASMCGGGFIGALVYAINLMSTYYSEPVDVNSFASPTMFGCVVVLGILPGLFGSLLDSLLGATVQASYLDLSRKVILSHAPSSNAKGNEVKHICGLDILDNHLVNLVSCVATGLVTPLFWFMYVQALNY
eukprot:Nk52_evm1s675 gene=Nk52_evmTU1s675